PDVSISKNGQVYTVWSGTSPGNNEVFLATRPANSTTFDEISVLSNDSESMPFNPQLALSESGEVNVVWNTEQISGTGRVNVTQQNITSCNNITNVQPSIVLKKVETSTNATGITNNTATMSQSSSS